jgi:hypothetical protein
MHQKYQQLFLMLYSLLVSSIFDICGSMLCKLFAIMAFELSYHCANLLLYRCIILDDEDDKKTEISRMHRIYGNAYLTIVSALTSSVNEYLLVESKPRPYRPGELSRRVQLELDQASLK